MAMDWNFIKLLQVERRDRLEHALLIFQIAIIQSTYPSY